MNKFILGQMSKDLEHPTTAVHPAQGLPFFAKEPTRATVTEMNAATLAMPTSATTTAASEVLQQTPIFSQKVPFLAEHHFEKPSMTTEQARRDVVTQLMSHKIGSHYSSNPAAFMSTKAQQAESGLPLVAEYHIQQTMEKEEAQRQEDFQQWMREYMDLEMDKAKSVDEVTDYKTAK